MVYSLNRKFMVLAIREARKNLQDTQGGPFGACIVRHGIVLAVARNTVLKEDATSHAEINAIRCASRKIKNFNLQGCQIYSTTEPCPMCFSAIHWAGIKTIIYGTNIKDASKRGFNELPINTKIMNKLSNQKIKIYNNFLIDECLALLKSWDQLENKTVY